MKLTQHLINYLDSYYFVSEDEIEMAVGEYIEQETGSLYWSDLACSYDLAREYMEHRGMNFNKRK